ncbi:MAG: hypothetical protein L0Y42_00275 [Phycisphaerales bacterium]|nr:hypothetical protein [Phycisphaerales bacterium]
MLEQYLATREALCPRCRYNLRALRGHSCPECGERISLQIGPGHPRQPAFITGIIGLAASAGFSGLLLAYVLFHALVVPTRLWWPFALVTGVEFVVSALLLTIWLMAGPRIRRLRRGVRLSLALLCLAVPLISIVVFTTVN